MMGPFPGWVILFAGLLFLLCGADGNEDGDELITCASFGGIGSLAGGPLLPFLLSPHVSDGASWSGRYFFH